MVFGQPSFFRHDYGGEKKSFLGPGKGLPHQKCTELLAWGPTSLETDTNMIVNKFMRMRISDRSIHLGIPSGARLPAGGGSLRMGTHWRRTC